VLGPPPTASFTSSCTLLGCSFDGTGSTGPSEGIASYSWDFGDGGSDTVATPSHTYAQAGSYTVKLTVTDGLGQTATTSQQVVVTAVTYVASSQTTGKAAATGGACTTACLSVTEPSTVQSGNGLVLVTSAVGTVAPTAPAGWTLVRTAAATSMNTAVYTRVADGTDASSTVTVGFGSAVVGSVQLLVYSGTSTTNPLAVVGSAVNNATSTTETTPTVTVTAPGSLVVSLWQAKTTALLNWTPPAGVTVRSTAIGTGGGHLAALAADSGAVVPVGSYGGLVATGDGTAGAATTWTLVLAPAGT